MKELRRRFERFCFKNRNKGIPNLMFYICIGSGILALFSLIDDSGMLYSMLGFDRELILRGQVWRLFTYPLCFAGSNLLWTVIILFCYYSLGRAIENSWGTFRFNLYYFTGILLMDVFCMIFGGAASAHYLHLSLFLAYATLYPDSQFLVLYIIPVKAWVLALIDLFLIVSGVFGNSFPYNLFPVIALGNYFLFFGKDVKNLIPISWQANARRAARKATRSKAAKTIPFHSAGSWEATRAAPQAPYNHRCTVCGKTDTDHPELEFRYCSRCKGYYCYCQDHISSHSHIE